MTKTKEATKFQAKVYSVAKKIPRGKTLSYGQIAQQIGSSPRAIGNALKKNKNKDVPCHRVVCSDGSVGGYNKGTKKKIQLLRKEGVKINRNKIVYDTVKL